MEIVIPTVVWVGAMFLGHWLIRAGRWRILWGLVTVIVLISGWQWVSARSATSGWDGIAIMLLVVLFLMPGLIGLLAGAWLAWWRARRAGPGDVA